MSLGWNVNSTTAAAVTRVTAPRQANRLPLVPVATRYWIERGGEGRKMSIQA